MGTPSPVAFLPAIDLRRGRCVRLQKGDAAQETAYGDDPLAVARGFAEAGAEWTHVVDLDAAFGDGSNRPLIARIAAETGVRIQTGGGLRTLDDLAAIFDAGIARAVVGTAAIENPAFVEAAVARWGSERIAVGIDARGRTPAVRGWTEATAVDLFDLASRLVDCGVQTIIYTDIDRDGMLVGPNLDTAAELAERSGAEVVVSGGVGSADDLESIALAAATRTGIAGVIVGKALYEGRVDLTTALQRLGA